MSRARLLGLVLSTGVIAACFVWRIELGESLAAMRAAVTSLASVDVVPVRVDASGGNPGATPEPIAGPISRARPGSMQARLLSASDLTRRETISRILRRQGFECPEPRSVDPVGADGSAWRANCGEAHIYWVGVDDVDGIEIRPAAYGDIDGVRPVTPVVTPEGRRLELRQDELRQETE